MSIKKTSIYVSGYYLFQNNYGWRDYLGVSRLFRFPLEKYLREVQTSDIDLKSDITNFITTYWRQKLDDWVERTVNDVILHYLIRNPDIISDGNLFPRLCHTIYYQKWMSIPKPLFDAFVAGMKPCLQFDAVCPHTNQVIKIHQSESSEDCVALDVGNSKEVIKFKATTPVNAHPFFVYSHMERKRKQKTAYLYTGIQLIDDGFKFSQYARKPCIEAKFEIVDGKLNYVYSYSYVIRKKASIVVGPRPEELKSSIVNSIYKMLQEQKHLLKD